MADEQEETLFVDRAEFVECEDATDARDPRNRVVLLTLSRADKTDLKLTKEQVEASQRGEGEIEVPVYYDLIALGDHDSRKLMLALAGIRAEQGCPIARKIILLAGDQSGS